MKAFACIVLLAASLLLWAQSSFAIEPAYSGPLGNPEEPAMRPYKWLWSGLKSLVYHPVVAFEQGNRKIPGLGSVEVFRGIRRGSVELDESAFRGILCTRPPASDQYKKLGRANTAIEAEPLLSSVTDLLAPNLVDAHPVTTAEERTAMEVKAKADRETRKRDAAAPASKGRGAGMTALERARKEYVGERAEINRKPPLTGNVLRPVP